MKKLFSLLLAAVLALGLTTIAWAVTEEELRKAVYEDLDHGLLLGLTMTIQEMEEMGNPVHHLTRDARDYLLKRGIR